MQSPQHNIIKHHFHIKYPQAAVAFHSFRKHLTSDLTPIVQYECACLKQTVDDAKCGGPVCLTVSARKRKKPEANASKTNFELT